MLQLLQHHQIDRQKWDACIGRSKEGLVYALSWYLDLVSPGWEALVEQQPDSYVTVVPLPKARKFGFPFLRQPLYCQQLGVFSVAEEGVSDRLAPILELLFRHYRHIRDYSFNTANPPLPANAQPHLVVRDFYTHHLSLNDPYPHLYQRYSRDRKVNLKRAQKANSIVFESEDIRPLIAIFREDTAHKIYGGVAEEAYDLLFSLHAGLHQRGLARLLYTRNNKGEIEAGCLFVFYRNRLTYLFNAATRKGRSLNGRSLMIDRIIKEYAGQEVVLDFESPAGLEPIIYFYQGFGSKPVRYQTITYSNLPPLIKLIKSTRIFLYQKLLAASNKGQM